MNKHNEIKKKIQIAEFTNNKRLYVLDIRDWKNEFSKFCLSSVEAPKRANKEYMIPNYFSDCLKLCGIDGILYKNDDNANLYAFLEMLILNVLIQIIKLLTKMNNVLCNVKKLSISY